MRSTGRASSLEALRSSCSYVCGFCRCRQGRTEMIDLTTQYLGLELRNPLVVAASPLSNEISNLREMEDAGAGAIVLRSLFEEEIKSEVYELDRFLAGGAAVGAENSNIYPDLSKFGFGLERYLARR